MSRKSQRLRVFEILEPRRLLTTANWIVLPGDGPNTIAGYLVASRWTSPVVPYRETNAFDVAFDVTTGATQIDIAPQNDAQAALLTDSVNRITNNSLTVSDGSVTLVALPYVMTPGADPPRYNVDSSLTIGTSSDLPAELTVKGFPLTVSESAIIGAGLGSTGVLNIVGDEPRVLGELVPNLSIDQPTDVSLQIGLEGNGTVNVDDGAVFQTEESVNIGENAGSTGMLSIDGATFKDIGHFGDKFIVGGLGEGTLNASNASHVTIDSELLDVGAFASGKIVVTEGSTVDIPVDKVIIGDNANGALYASGDSTINAGGAALVIGDKAGATGLVSLVGSAYTSTGAVKVGGIDDFGRLQIVGSKFTATSMDVAASGSFRNNTTGPDAEAFVGGNSTVTLDSLTVGGAVGGRFDTGAGFDLSNSTLNVKSAPIIIGDVLPAADAFGGILRDGQGSTVNAPLGILVTANGGLTGQGVINGSVTLGKGSNAAFFDGFWLGTPSPGPGNIAGMTINGDLIANAGSVMDVAIADHSNQQANYGVTVSGAVSLDGNLQVSPDKAPGAGPSTYTIGDTFQVIRSSGAVLGAFASVDYSRLARLPSGLEWQVVYGQNSVALRVAAIGAPAALDLRLRDLPDLYWIDGFVPNNPMHIGVSAADFFAQQTSPVTDQQFISSVSFYVSTDPGYTTIQQVVNDATPVGDGATFNSLDGQWEQDIPTGNGFFSGENETLYAIATDNFGVKSDPVSINFTYEAAPYDGYFIGPGPSPGDSGGTLTDSTSTASGSIYEQYTTLSANDFTSSDDSPVQSVSLYRGYASDGQYTYLGTAGQADDSGNWNLTLDTTGASGSFSYFAVATFQNGLQSAPVYDGVTLTSPTVAYVSAMPSSDGSSIVLAASGVSSSAQSVAFYQDSTGMGPGDPDLAAQNSLGNATLSGGVWTLNVNPSNLSGYDIFYAVATDGNGSRSAPVFASLYPDPPPTIGSFTVASDRYTAGEPLTLTATVTDADGALGGVNFYHQVGDTATFLGAGIFDGSSYTFDVDTTNMTGSQTFFATAYNNDSSTNSSAITVTPDSAASIAGVSAAPTAWDPVSGRVTQVSLDADVLGDAESVWFYASSNGTFADASYLGTGTALPDGTGWTLGNIDATEFSCSTTFFAEAIDTNGVATDPVPLTIGPATIGALTVTPAASGTLTLSAENVIDFTSPVTSVSFYQDTSGTGVYNSATATLLGTATAADGEGNWTLSIDASSSYGPQTYFAIATDGDNATGNVVAATSEPPVVTSLTAALSDFESGEYRSLTLAAQTEGAAPIAGVAFYEDTTGATAFNPATATLIGQGTENADGSWSATLQTGSLGAGATIFAVATDADGLNSAGFALADATGQPVTAGQYFIGQFAANLATTTTYDIFGEPTTTSTLTLTAGQFVDPAGTTQSVAFYEDPNGSTTFDATNDTLLGTVHAANGWSLTIDASALTGSETFFAVASDASSNSSNPVWAIAMPSQGPVSVAGVQAESETLSNSSLVTLTAYGVTGGDGMSQSVSYYEDLNGSTTFNASTDVLLGTSSNPDNNFQFTAALGSLTGTETYFAVATDGLSTSNAAVTLATSAQVLYWDPSQSAGANLGGSGEWTNGGAADWYDPVSGTDAVWDNSSGAVAVFGGTGGTVTVDSGITAGSVRFTTTGNNGYSLYSGSISLGAGAALDVATGGQAWIYSQLADSDALTQTGTGSLYLLGRDSFGEVDMLSGTLQIDAPNGSVLTLWCGSGPYGPSRLAFSFDQDGDLVFTKSGSGQASVEGVPHLGSSVVYKIAGGILTVPGPNGETLQLGNFFADPDVRVSLGTDRTGETVLVKDGTGELDFGNAFNVNGPLNVGVLDGSVYLNVVANIFSLTPVAQGISDAPSGWAATFDGAGDIVYCGHNVYVSDPGDLVSLDCSWGSLDGTLNLSACTALTNLNCGGDQLTSLDVSGCTHLTYLDCDSNELTSLNLRDCSALAYLDCDTNLLASLSLNDCTALTYLDCDTNQLASLNVSGCMSLVDLYCEVNQISSLNFSGCTSLTSLDCDSNLLTTLDVSGCTALHSLGSGENPLSSLNVSGCTQLDLLNCDNDRLTSLDISGITSLAMLFCSGNELTSLNVSGQTALTYFDCSYNDLVSLNVGGASALYYLDCNGDGLTSLSLSGCTSLAYLYCNGNQLSSLDVGGLSALAGLWCSDNQLSSLNLSGQTALAYLNCNSNQLSSLSVATSRLEYLDCSNNQLTAASVDAALNACSSAYIFGGYANVGGGTNAAPTTTSAPNVAALWASHWWVYTN